MKAILKAVLNFILAFLAYIKTKFCLAYAKLKFRCKNSPRTEPLPKKIIVDPESIKIHLDSKLFFETINVTSKIVEVYVKPITVSSNIGIHQKSIEIIPKVIEVLPEPTDIRARTSVESISKTNKENTMDFKPQTNEISETESDRPVHMFVGESKLNKTPNSLGMTHRITRIDTRGTSEVVFVVKMSMKDGQDYTKSQDVQHAMECFVATLNDSVNLVIQKGDDG